jgi:hypothetical protein
VSATDPIELLRKTRALEARCDRLERRGEALEELIILCQEKAAAAESKTAIDLAFVLKHLNLCGLAHPDSGHRCGLPAGHHETVHSSGRLPKQVGAE